MELLPVQDDVEEEVEQIGQRQREETHVDALPEPLPVEHGHVDQVGGASEQEQDGQDHHVLQAADQVLRARADQVVRVVPGQEVQLELQHEAVRGRVRHATVGCEVYGGCRVTTRHAVRACERGDAVDVCPLPRHCGTDDGVVLFKGCQTTCIIIYPEQGEFIIEA